jgi:hypothetical protein
MAGDQYGLKPRILLLFKPYYFSQIAQKRVQICADKVLCNLFQPNLRINQRTSARNESLQCILLKKSPLFNQENHFFCNGIKLLFYFHQEYNSLIRTEYFSSNLIRFGRLSGVNKPLSAVHSSATHLNFTTWSGPRLPLLYCLITLPRISETS